MRGSPPAGFVSAQGWRTVAVGLLAAVSWAGCASPAQPVTPLEEIFGVGSLWYDVANETYRINGTLLEIRFAHESAEWASWAELAINASTITLSKAEPGVQGGAGETRKLPAPVVDASVEVRFINHTRLTGYAAEWTVTAIHANRSTTAETGPAAEAYTFHVDQPGRYVVTTRLLREGRLVGVVDAPIYALVNFAYRIESAVHPVRAPAAPPPDNYEEMADRFQLELHHGADSLRAHTRFRGTWQPGQGTDVDLEVDRPNGSPARCSTSKSFDEPGPGDSLERIEIGSVFPRGTWTVRVGAVRIQQNCANDFDYYTNAALVPYALQLEIRFDPPFMDPLER